MRRRNCSLTESLEPRLVLSTVSPRGGVDPPRDASADSETSADQQDVPVNRDGSDQSVETQPVRQTANAVDSDSAVRTQTPASAGPSANVVVLDSEETESTRDRLLFEGTDTRTDSPDVDSLDDDLVGDSLSADDRTSALIDSGVTASDARADDDSVAEESVAVTAAGVDSSSESPPASSAITSLTRPRDTRLQLSDVDLPVVGESLRDVPDAALDARMAFTETSSIDVGSWWTSLASSLKAWLKLDGIANGSTVAFVESSVPFVAMAGGFSLVAAGRKGVVESDASDSEEGGAGVWKSDRRGGRVIDRRRARWLEFLMGNRPGRRNGAASAEQRSPSRDLSAPDISEAFAMSLMQPVSNEAFLLSPMKSGDEVTESDEAEADSAWAPEMVAAGAAAVAGGTVIRKNRRSRGRTSQRAVIDYSGTTLPQWQRAD